MSKPNERSYPDAALQIVELNPSAVYGVFRCNGCQDWRSNEFQTWRLRETVDDLSSYLSATLIRAFEDAAKDTGDTSAFRLAGEALYNKIFSDGSGNQSLAERKFVAFVNAYAARADPATLFVRLLPSSTKPLSLVPLGLMSIPAMYSRAGFLGLKFIIESPLEIQDYSTAAACISRWSMLVPPDGVSDVDMFDARSSFQSWIDRFSQAPQGATLFDDINAFGRWLNASAAPDPATAIVILSHHDQDQLFFDSSRVPSILSANIQRRFAGPSVAIVNACGTATPGAFDVVKQLNRRGVTTVLATATAVDSKMSGAFLTTLMNQLRNSSRDADYTMRRAKFDAVRLLSQKPEYGPRLLIYSLVGNGLVRLCPPTVP